MLVGGDNIKTSFAGYTGGRLSDVEVVNPFTNSRPQCTEIDDLPEPRAGMVSVTIGNNIRVCGGTNSSSPYYSNAISSCYQLSGNHWILTTEHLKHPRTYAASIKLDGKIWIVGGQGSPLTSELFNGLTNTFEEDVRLPEEMIDHCMAAINSTHTYIIGRQGLSDENKMAYIVSHLTNPFTFRKLKPTITERQGSACAVILQTSWYPQERNILFVAGAHFFGHSTEMYLPYQEKWVDGPHLPGSFWAGGLITTDQATILFGGYQSNDVIIINHRTLELKLLLGKLKNKRRYSTAIPLHDGAIC